MKSNRDLPIGVIDSGVGGLLALRSLTERLPNEEWRYLGDSARSPYGIRSEEIARRAAGDAFRLLADREIKALIVTSTSIPAAAVGAMRVEVGGPVVSAVPALAKAAARASETGRIGVLTTDSARDARAFEQAIHALNPACNVSVLSSRLLYEMAEEGLGLDAAVDLVLRESLRPLFEAAIDTLVLGASHYSVFAAAIAEVAGSRVRVVDVAGTLVDEVPSALAEADLMRADSLGCVECLLTDTSDHFLRAARSFYGRPINPVIVGAN